VCGDSCGLNELFLPPMPPDDALFTLLSKHTVGAYRALRAIQEEGASQEVGMRPPCDDGDKAPKVPKFRMLRRRVRHSRPSSISHHDPHNQARNHCKVAEVEWGISCPILHAALNDRHACRGLGGLRWTKPHDGVVPHALERRLQSCEG
jgi:hypothetical protein